MRKRASLGLFYLVLMLFLIEVVSAATLNVDINDGGCVSGSGQPDPYSVVYCNIQDAIDDASSGDTINVASGTYNERLVINKNITLNGAGSSTVIQPTNAPSAGVYDVEIDANGTIIQNFLFDFNGVDDARGGPDTGIVVCDLDEPPVTNVWILNNIIYTGHEDTSLETGKNCDVSGLLIRGNTFYADEDGMGEGIYINPYPGSGVTIDYNKFYGYLFSGISVEAGNVNVTNNTINSNSSKGIYGVRFIDIGGGQTYDDVIIAGNNIQNVEYGIRIGTTSDLGSSLTATIQSNTLTNNDVGIWVRYGAYLANSAHYNNIFNNTDYGVNNAAGERVVNATLNWWGDISGPGGIGQGIGDNISDNVDYSPWLGLEVGSVPMTYGVDNSSSIQEIIDFASDGDTIYVADGIYNENVVIDKEINLIGTGYSSTTIIDCLGSGTGISVNTDNSLISGFEIKNCNYGIRVFGNDNTIANSSLHDNNKGIRFDEALNNVVNLNEMYGNTNYGLRNYDIEQVNAEYNWWGACDGPSGDGPGSGDKVLGNVSFIPWIGLCIENKTNVTCKYETDNITLEADLVGAGIEDVLFSITINSTNQNKSAIKGMGNSYYYTIPSIDLVGGQNVIWNVFANDSFGRTYNNSWKTFYVRNRTILIVNPSNPDGENEWYTTEPLFSLIKDNSGGNMYYQWDSNDIWLYSIPFKLGNIPNPPNVSAGILELNWWADFGQCGNESKQSQVFYIDLTNPRVVDLEPLGGVINNLRPTISAYLDEVWQSNSGINRSRVVMKLDGQEVNANVSDADELDAIVSYLPQSDLSGGTHNVSVYVEDYAGRSNETFWEFEIIITPALTMVINLPVVGIYGERKIPFNITLSGSVELLQYIDWNYRRPRWRTLCRNCDDYGNTTKRTASFLDGEHNLTIRAVDSYGQIKDENILFFIDTKEPRILRTKPTRREVTNGTGFYVKYSEDNLKEVLVSWNPVVILTGCTESGRNKECYINLDLSAYDGQYINYSFNVSDYVRSIQSRVTSVLVDMTAPVLTVNSPENNETYGRRVLFDIDVSEEVTLEYIDYSDSTPRWRRLCNNCDEYTRRKSLSRGIHNIMIRATDKAGNSDAVEREFIVDY